jgi:hypothetical protein
LNACDEGTVNEHHWIGGPGLDIRDGDAIEPEHVACTMIILVQ